jgi:3-deoxy-D-manno-octulosonic-acid transferase
MRRLYTVLLWVLMPWVLIRLAMRGFRNRGYWRRIRERFGFINPPLASRVIWVHAVSVGEVRAAAPLLKKFAERWPHDRILITTMTPTGSATVANLFGDAVAHVYVPYDVPWAVRRFLDRTHPRLAVIMETELWPNLFHECRARGIPLVVANVRMSERSMRGYLRFASLTRATLAQVSRFGVQNETDAQRLLAMGADPRRLAVTGSIKFELALPASLREAAEVLRREWGASRPVWIAASTHEGEDELVLEAHAELRRQPRFANALLVLVPRHPERFAAVAKLCRRRGFDTVQRSQTPGPLAPGVEVLVADTMGELQLFYAAADAAFVGGSLVPTGGHNLLEPAAVGKPSVFGPHMFNFAEIAAMTLDRGAGTQIRGPAELAPAIGDFLGNANRRFEAGEAGRRMVEENRGALERTVELIEAVIGEQ